MKNKLYKDLYKLEPGVYLLRLDPNILSEDFMRNFIDNATDEFLKAGIFIQVVVAPKDGIEFIPAIKKEKDNAS